MKADAFCWTFLSGFLLNKKGDVIAHILMKDLLMKCTSVVDKDYHISEYKLVWSRI